MAYYQDSHVTLHRGDALEVLRGMASGSVDCVVTSPPYYGLRDYSVEGQYGLESSLGEYVENLRRVFSEVKRVLADSGTLWLNIGDSYVSSGGGAPGVSAQVGATGSGVQVRRGSSALPVKSLLGVPWRVAFALQDDGWILRNDIIWHKPNAMPESVTDRMSGKFEYVFLFAKQPKYHLRLDAYRVEPKEKWRPRPGVPGKLSGGGMAPGVRPNSIPPTGQRARPHPKGSNPGDIWSISTQPLYENHPGAFPVELPSRCVAMGCPPGGAVLDPFSGAGTTGLAALRFHRKYIGIELNQEYLELSVLRLAKA